MVAIGTGRNGANPSGCIERATGSVRKPRNSEKLVRYPGKREYTGEAKTGEENARLGDREPQGRNGEGRKIVKEKAARKEAANGVVVGGRGTRRIEDGSGRGSPCREGREEKEEAEGRT